MRQVLGAVLLGLVSVGAVLPQQKVDREAKVRADKAKLEAAGYWIYNDLPKAFAEAKTTGKPILVVLRCIPCEECVKLDDELIDDDARMKPLLEQFVRVRVVSTNGLDLSTFQYDTDQSFAVFLLNADGTVYGRFGTRSHRTNWLDDVSIDGLSKAMKAALGLHKGYPKNNAALAQKRGPAPEFARPELIPTFAGKYTASLNYAGKVVPSCIHCHMIGDAQRDLALQRKKGLPESLLFPYPHPKSLGLILDPKECASVLRAEPGSDAAKAGLRAGDIIQTFAGQPMLSIADVQWVLQNTPAEGAEVKLVVVRAGKTVPLTLSLPSGWRRRDDLSWRASTWGLRRAALGGLKLDPNPGGKGLLVANVGQYAPHDRAKKAGMLKGDVVVSVDGRTDFTRETDVIAYCLQEKKADEPLVLGVQRGGQALTITVAAP